MSNFDPTSISRFRFVRRAFDADSGRVELAYAFDDGEEMVETLVIPGAPFALDAARQSAVDAALRLLHLIAGVSYFKAAVPPEIVVDDGALDAETAALLTSIYENGLGEFAYNNGLALRGRIRFPVDESTGTRAMPTVGLEHRALVAIGGGKDSLVSIESLRDAGVAQTVAWIGGSQLIAACAAKTGLPTLNIERRLAPRLFELNREGALNGHIPVTAINSAILVLVALLTGHDQVVFSNEHSASYGSLIPGTGEVNHQWSKGWDFERTFGSYIARRVAPDLRYYSLLRPLSELAVAQRFARISGYDDVFSSCNRNFHLLGEKPSSRWCGHCPKCRFVFLALAPFMPKPRLLGIFGRNLLDESPQIAGFDALLEFRDHKPFECVGEGVESRSAMNALTERAEWREDALVRRFADEVLPHLDGDELDLADQLQPRGEHRLPTALAARLTNT